MYLGRIASSVPKALGERPHGFRLNDPGFFDEEFDTEHGQFLKQGVEKVIAKMEILSSVTLKNRRFKIKAEERLDKLEEAMLRLVTKEDYNHGLNKAESRISDYVREQMMKSQETLVEQKNVLDETINEFDQKINDYRKQVLWRIKDAEELLKGRVST